MSSFHIHPSLDRKETRTTQWTRNSLLILNGLCRFMYKTWMESTYGKPNINPYFFVTTEPNRMGFFAEMQIISDSFIILIPKAYSDWFTILKAIDAESPIVIFFWQSVQWLWAKGQRASRAEARWPITVR